MSVTALARLEGLTVVSLDEVKQIREAGDIPTGLIQPLVQLEVALLQIAVAINQSRLPPDNPNSK